MYEAYPTDFFHHTKNATTQRFIKCGTFYSCCCIHILQHPWISLSDLLCNIVWPVNPSAYKPLFCLHIYFSYPPYLHKITLCLRIIRLALSESLCNLEFRFLANGFCITEYFSKFGYILGAYVLLRIVPMLCTSYTTCFVSVEQLLNSKSH